MNKLEELKTKMAELKNQMVIAGKESLREFSQEIFNKYPWIEKFSWNQYTPYWCDGDVCEFSVNTYSLKINELDSPKTKKEKPAFKEVCKLLESIGDSIMEDMFGDHCKVTVTKDDVKVEEYEHD